MLLIAINKTLYTEKYLLTTTLESNRNAFSVIRMKVRKALLLEIPKYHLQLSKLAESVLSFVCLYSFVTIKIIKHAI